VSLGETCTNDTHKRHNFHAFYSTPLGEYVVCGIRFSHVQKVVLWLTRSHILGLLYLLLSPQVDISLYQSVDGAIAFSLSNLSIISRLRFFFCLGHQTIDITIIMPLPFIPAIIKLFKNKFWFFSTLAFYNAENSRNSIIVVYCTWVILFIQRSKMARSLKSARI
jgi:hypothetical protein